MLLCQRSMLFPGCRNVLQRSLGETMTSGTLGIVSGLYVDCSNRVHHKESVMSETVKLLLGIKVMCNTLVKSQAK